MVIVLLAAGVLNDVVLGFAGLWLAAIVGLVVIAPLFLLRRWWLRRRSGF